MPVIRKENSQGFSASDMTTSSMTNSAVETTLFTTPIPAGSMGTVRELNFRLICSLTSSTINPSLTIRIKYGASTLTAISGLSIGLGVSNKPFIIQGMIANQGTANAQIAYATIIQSGSTLSLGSGAATTDIAKWTIDSSQTQTFSVTAQFSSALTGTTLTFEHASIELK